MTDRNDSCSSTSEFDDFDVDFGMNSRDALRVARKLGCDERRKGGDIILFHGKLKRHQRMKDPTRRKDASAKLVEFLLDLVQALRSA